MTEQVALTELVADDASPRWRRALKFDRAPARRTTVGPVGALSYLVWGSPGDAVPLVLLHPVNTAGVVWDPVAQLLAAERAVYAVDYRAHGQSVPGGPYLPTDYAADGAAVMAAEGIEHAHVAGGSIGGAVSVELALSHPSHVCSISMFGAAVRIGVTAGQMDEMERGIRALGVSGFFAKHGGDIVGSASVPGVVHRHVDLAGQGRDTETVIEVVRQTFQFADSRAAAAAVAGRDDIPVFVATGNEDPTCPPDMAREIARGFSTTPVLLDGIGHLPMLEAPALTAALLQGFMAATSS